MPKAQDVFFILMSMMRRVFIYVLGLLLFLGCEPKALTDEDVFGSYYHSNTDIPVAQRTTTLSISTTLKLFSDYTFEEYKVVASGYPSHSSETFEISDSILTCNFSTHLSDKKDSAGRHIADDVWGFEVTGALKYIIGDNQLISFNNSSVVYNKTLDY